jgi:hypothetical protein
MKKNTILDDTTLENKTLESYTTIKQFINFYENHPEYEGKSFSELQNDTIHGGDYFCKFYGNLVEKKSKGDKEYAKILMRIIFVNDTAYY